jgi:hypothetical protein
MKRLIFSLVAVGSMFVVAFAVGRLVRGKVAAPREEGPTLAASREDLEQQLTYLRGQVAGLKASVGQLRAKAAGPPATTEVPGHAEAAADDPQAMAEKAQAFREAEARLLQEAFEREPRDRDWAPAAIEQIRKVYSAEDLAGVTVEPDCRSTLCRLDLRFQSAGDASRLAQQLSLRVPWPSVGYVQGDTETLRGVYYLTRQGHELARASLPAP